MKDSDGKLASKLQQITNKRHFAANKLITAQSLENQLFKCAKLLTKTVFLVKPYTIDTVL